MMSTLYCDDAVCPDCGEEPVLLSCQLCGVRGNVVECGHYDLPRPLSTSCGVDWPRIVCDDCERTQEELVELIAAMLKNDPKATDSDATTFRRAVNVALRGVPESKSPQGTHAAVAYVWNNGRWRECAKNLIRWAKDGRP